jgi:hypothetical protein
MEVGRSSRRQNVQYVIFWNSLCVRAWVRALGRASVLLSIVSGCYVLWPVICLRLGVYFRHWSCLRRASLCTCFSAVSLPVVTMVSLLHNSALGKFALALGILTVHSPGLSSRKTSRYIVRWKGFESSEHIGWAVNGVGICLFTYFC